MTDLDIIERAAVFFGTKPQACRPQKAHHKPSWKLTVKGARAVELMLQLYPFMGQRRQAQIQEAVWSYGPDKRRNPLAHGTNAMYGKHGCRCNPCLVAHRESMRKWREET